MRNVFLLLALGGVVALSGCGGSSNYVPAAQSAFAASPATAASAARAAAASSMMGEDETSLSETSDPLDVFSDATVAGTYNGTVTATESGKSVKGTASITLTQSGNDIGGKIVYAFGGTPQSATYAGTGHRVGHAYKMSLKAVGTKGCTATGPGTIVKKRFTGSYVAPPCNGAASVTYKYNTVKT